MRFHRIIAASILAVAGFAATAHAAPGFYVFYADIANDGTVFKASGANGSIRLSTGRYQVTFTRSVNKCAITANSTSGATSVIRTGTTSVIEVRTYDLGNALSDRSFNMTAVCNQ